MPTPKRSTKNILLSTAIHGGLLAALWFTASELSTPEPKEPEIIDATILPPPVETPKPELEVEKSSPMPSIKTSSPSITPPKQSLSVPNKGIDKPSTPVADNGAQAPSGTDTGKPNSAPAASTDSTGAATPTKPLTNSVPIAVSPIGGFSIEYDAMASKGSIEQAGGARFVFNKTPTGYSVDLNAKASIGSFSAHSEGEIRGDTIATTRFKDSRKISFLGMGSEKTGSNFIVSYPEKSINFGGTTDGTRALQYSAVYDYLSAMVYLQALLQQHPNQGRAGNTLSLPIGKRTEVQMATVTFKNPETISTYESGGENGGTYTAVPANINIPSGSIKSLDVWFVPEKNYRPLQIELGFNSGKAKLISRRSN